MKPKPAKIPTILGLLTIIVVGVILGVLMVYSKQIYNFLIPVNDKPTQVRITNVTKDSFTVSWVTKQPTNGFLTYGKGKTLDQTVLQTSEISTPSYVHSVQVENLKPETSYNFQIGVELPSKWKREFGKYSVETTKEIKDGVANIIFGSVINSSSKPVPGAVVYITIQGVQPLSTITDTDGGWTINLGHALSSNLEGGASYDPDKSQIEIFVQTGKQFASARAIIGAAKPVPPLALGKSYDFTKNQTVISGEAPKSLLALPNNKEATESSKSSTKKPQ